MTNKKKEGGEMKVTSLKVSADQWHQAKVKATQDKITLTKVVSSLLAKWLKGEVTIDDDKDQ